jgi:NAD(P)-dependent dehydrogenase (short-subunit alcohol dehydrogenase family)
VAPRTVLVTGGSSGIGRATAIAFARQGAKVIVAARSAAKLAEVASESAGVETVSVSLATPEGCEQAYAEAVRRLGSVDVLVNNAGTDLDEGRPIWDQRDSDWRGTLAINLDAPFFLSRLASGEMVRRRWGRIVMVSSTAGQVGAPGTSSYCASKHGLLGLMRAIAQDVAPFGVTCNAVLPGWVQTPAADNSAKREAEARGLTADEIWSERRASYAAGRVLSPEEIADAIVFLAGDGASGINGEAMTIALGGTW